MSSLATGVRLRYLLDTHIISQLMRAPQGVVATHLHAKLDAGRDLQIGTSLVVACEIWFGLERKPSPALQAAYDKLMQVIEILPMDQAVLPHYASTRQALERQGKPIGANDLLIAAHALALGAVVVTDNETEFLRVPGLVVENWLRPES